MKLARLSMRNPVGTALFALTLGVLGTISLNSLPIAYWPNITPPFLIVQTPYPGVSPEDIEEEVTKPIEQVISTVDNIYEVESSSIEGISQIIVRFDWGTDVNEAKIDLREKIDGARGQLPRDIQPTSILALDALIPAPYEIAVSSDRYDQGTLRKLLEDKIVSRLLRLPNVAAVDVRGGRQKVVRVEADPRKMMDLGITLTQAATAVGAENVNMPAGTLEQGSREFILRTFNKYQSLDDIRNVIVTQSGMTPVRVRDFATVRLVDDQRIGIARIDGKPALAMSIRQASGGNTVALVNEAAAEIRVIETAYPHITFRVIKDDSIFIRNAIKAVTTNVALGGLIAALFIYLFLGNIRNTLIISLSIPVSILATFLVMQGLGLTLNTISLGGLALGVGMIVDASIVVLENIYYRLRSIKSEYGNLSASQQLDVASDAVSEVALPITASISTSVVVFLPLAFTKGLAFFLLGELSLTVVAALLFSLLVSFTLIPMLSYKLMSVSEPKFFLAKLWGRFIDWLIRIYEPLVRLVAKNWKRSLVAMFASLLLMVIPLLGAKYLDIEQLPKIDEGLIRVDVEFPQGTALDATSGMVADMEEKIMALPHVEQVYSVVGLTAFYNQSTPNIAYINVRIPTLGVDTDQLMHTMRERLTGYPDAKINVRTLSIAEGMSQSGIDLRVVGPDLDSLTAISNMIVDSLQAYPEAIDVKSNMEAGKPEFRVVVDRVKAQSWGLSPSRVASYIRTAVDGQAVTRYSAASGELYDVDISLTRASVANLPELRRLPIQTPRGTVIPLNAVADFVIQPGPANIRRSDQERFLSVTAQAASGVRERDLRVIGDQVEKHIKLPPDYQWKIAGVARSIKESFRSLAVALVLAIFLVYVVMASQFNNLWQPLVIATAIPFSLIGAVIGLLIFGGALNVNSFLGIIMLSGIVVNNGILLIDFINRARRDEGMPRFEAIVQAGQRRLRPILMTTLTTMAGMLFIALGVGVGAETLIPLSAVVIGGLASSTLLTLLIVPSIYTLFDSVVHAVRRNRK